MSYGSALVFLIVAPLLGCAVEPAGGEAVQEGRSALESHSAPADTLDRLIERLKTVGGTFTRAGAEHDFRFDGSLEVVRALSAFGDSAVARLVECMDREEPTTTTLQGRPVPLGAMCFDALRRIAYYEATDAEGDVDADWPGYITVAADREARLRAQAAWKVVVENGWYRIP